MFEIKNLYTTNGADIDGKEVNAVELGEVVAVIKSDSGDWIEA